MLAELARLRTLQVAQAEALGRDDVVALEALHAERMRLQAALGRPALTGLAPHERARAQALLAEIAREQEALGARAAAAAGALGAELRSLGTGRSALSGYRPPGGAGSLLLDRAG